MLLRLYEEATLCVCFLVLCCVLGVLIRRALSTSTVASLSSTIDGGLRSTLINLSAASSKRGVLSDDDGPRLVFLNMFSRVLFAGESFRLFLPATCCVVELLIL